MAVSSTWDDEACTILRIELAGHWTWREAEVAFTEVARMIASVAPQPVCILLDFTPSLRLPVGALPHARRFSQNLPDNWDFTVMVGGGSIVHSVWSIFLRISPQLAVRYRSALTLSAARDMVAQERLTNTQN